MTRCFCKKAQISLNAELNDIKIHVPSVQNLSFYTLLTNNSKQLHFTRVIMFKRTFEIERLKMFTVHIQGVSSKKGMPLNSCIVRVRIAQDY